MLNCPKPERILEYVSIPREMNFGSRTSFSLHLLRCKKCQRASTRLRTRLNNLIVHEPDVTPSLLRVYSRLQKDETLILKGWKLDEITSRPRHSMLSNGWVFRGAVATVLLGIVSFVVFSKPDTNIPVAKFAENKIHKPPFAQIRLENKDRVEIRYVEPELLHSMEFETTNMSHNVSHTVGR